MTYCQPSDTPQGENSKPDTEQSLPFGRGMLKKTGSPAEKKEDKNSNNNNNNNNNAPPKPAPSRWKSKSFDKGALSFCHAGFVIKISKYVGLDTD